MDWDTQTNVFLLTLTAGTRRQYTLALHAFAAWYRQSYGVAPDPALLTAEEVRAWREELSDKAQLKAATVNQRLAAVKALARHCGRVVVLPGVQRVARPVEPLNGRELGRLLAAAEQCLPDAADPDAGLAGWRGAM